MRVDYGYMDQNFLETIIDIAENSYNNRLPQPKFSIYPPSDEEIEEEDEDDSVAILTPEPVEKTYVIEISSDTEMEDEDEDENDEDFSSMIWLKIKKWKMIQTRRR